MKKPLFVLAAALALVLCYGLPSALAADVPSPRHQYTLEFDLDMDAKRYSGTETILVVNRSQDAWTELLLRDYATVATLVQSRSCRDEEGREILLEPDETSARITELREAETGEALAWRREADDPSMVWVTLSRPLKPGESVKISFQYSADLFWGRGNLCWKQEGRTTYVNLGNFYPILSVYENGKWQGEPYYRGGEYFYSPVSDYQVTLTAPKGYIAAASAACGEPEAVEGRLRWSYEAESLRDFALCLSDGFEVMTAPCGSVEVRSYYPREEALVGERQLQAAVDSLALFGERFGYDYPYETYSVARSVMDSGGMEYPGLAILRGSVDLGRAEEVVERELAAYCDVVVHETAHQWFYAVVGSNSGLQPWLDEGMARFCELIYQERFTPERYGQTVEHMKYITDNHAPHSLNRSVAEMGQGYGTCAYSYGQRFLYELCEAMGADLFYECMGRYVRGHAMGEAHTSDFVNVFLRGSGWDAAVRAVMEEYLFPAYLDMVNDPAEPAAALLTAYGLMEGTAPGRFSPAQIMTRAETAVLLYRAAGEPGVAGWTAYPDVERGCWYEKAVLWASMEGLFPMQGIFGPEQAVTQAEFLTMTGRIWPRLELCGPDGGDAPLTRSRAAAILEQALMQEEL